MSEDVFKKAYNVPPIEDKKAAFQFLRNVYHADAESVLEKKKFPGEDTPRYDLYREGVNPAEVEGEVFTDFEKTLRKSLKQANKPISREMILDAVPEEMTERLIAEGYDMDKIINFEISTYNKYRGNWFNGVFGDVQLLLESLPDADAKKDFTQKIKALLTKHRLVYAKSLEEASDAQEVTAMKEERAEFIKDVDGFLEELINYCEKHA